MRYLWQNKPFSESIFKDVIGGLYTEDGWSTKTLEHHGYFIQQSKTGFKFFQKDDTLFVWTGYIFIHELESFFSSLIGLDLDSLHQKLTDLQGDFSLTIITPNEVTMVTNFFMRRPVFFFLDDENFCVSDVPGAIQNLHGNFYLVPRNSIWTINLETKMKVKSSPSATLAHTPTTEQEFVSLYQNTILKVFEYGYNPRGLGLSEGVDSGCIDATLSNGDPALDLIATGSCLGKNKKKVSKMITQRVAYRKNAKREIRHKVFPFNELDYNKVIDSVYSFIGRLSISSTEFPIDIVAAANLAKYFTDQNINQIFQGIGGTGHQFAVNWISYYPSILGKEKNHPDNSKKVFPRDMSIIYHPAMPALDWCLWENYVTDTVPYTIFGVEPYAPYYGLDLFCAFIGLPLEVKNQRHPFDTNEQANWPAVTIMDRYNYPYLTDGSNTCGPTFKMDNSR